MEYLEAESCVLTKIQCMKVGYLLFDAQSHTATFVDNGKGIVSMTNIVHVAQAVAAILSNPSIAKNTIVTIATATTTQAEMRATIESITDQDWSVKHVTSSELRKIGGEMLAKGDFNGNGVQVQAAAFGKENIGDLRAKGLWNEKLGLRECSVAKSLEAALKGKLVGE